MDPLGRGIARTGLTPNMISVIGYLGNVGAAVLVARGELVLGGVVMLIFSAFDLLDGAVARATNRVTRFGAVFDAVLDRLSEATLLFGLVVYYEDKGNSETEIFLIYAGLVGSVMVSYVRARAESFGIELREGLFTRPERVVLLGAGLILNFVLVALWVLAVLTNLTALQRLYAVYRKAKAMPPP
jgi:CDP-diacylglycerol--glycerol-3-phosphate 3-phosphatidyltransferase